MKNHSDKEHFSDDIEEISDDLSDISLLDMPVIVIFSLLLLIVALQFFTRYVLNDSLGWTEEAARYFLVSMGFVGAVRCVCRGSHIYLEFLYHYLSARFLKPVILLVELIVTAFWLYVGILSVQLALKTQASMTSLPISKAYLYYIVAAGCFLMSYYAVRNFLLQYKKPAADLAEEIHNRTSTGL